jgi:predicted DNA-binding transcriptional regulator AlpA
MQPEKQTAYTIAEFCQKYAIHRSTFYRNLKRGLMPPVIKLGAATRILAEDERAWLFALRPPSSPSG